jgi:hypothetical protein
MTSCTRLVTLLALVLAPACLPATAAPPPIVAVEQAVETSAGQLPLPGGGIGAVNLQPCARCRPVSLLAVTATRWIVGNQALPFDDFNRAVAAHRSAPVVVLYRAGSGEITRVIAQLPPGRPR